VFTGISFLPVFQANLDIEFGLRPALWVGIVSVGMAAMAVLGRWRQGRKAPAGRGYERPEGRRGRNSSAPSSFSG
jgi:sulfoxide reductase heme-binding subunit YedZ